MKGTKKEEKIPSIHEKSDYPRISELFRHLSNTLGLSSSLGPPESCRMVDACKLRFNVNGKTGL